MKRGKASWAMATVAVSLSLQDELAIGHLQLTGPDAIRDSLDDVDFLPGEERRGLGILRG